MELSLSKALAAVSMAFLTFLFTMLPLILVKNLKNEEPRNFRVMSFLSCFGGGVFMATCLLHLFPDVQEQMVLIFKTLNLEPNYPIAEFLLCVGFLIVMIVEQIVLYFQENQNLDKVPTIAIQHSQVESHCQNYGSINENTELLISDPIVNEGPVNTSSQSHVSSSEDHGHTHEISFHQDLSSHSILRSLLLVFALSLHSVFEGLAIGLQSSVQNVIRILLAVLIHKCVIAFTLGLNLTHSQLKRSNIIKGNILFSLTSPVGIIIGLVVVDFVTGLPMMVTSGILQGIAAGTFLYVTFFEVLPHELNANEDRMIKMGCLVLGFTVVSILIYLLPE